MPNFPKNTSAFRMSYKKSSFPFKSSPVKQDDDSVTRKEQRKSIVSEVQGMSKKEVRQYIKSQKKHDSYSRGGTSSTGTSKYKAPGLFASSKKKKSWVMAHELKSQPAPSQTSAATREDAAKREPGYDVTGG